MSYPTTEDLVAASDVTALMNLSDNQKDALRAIAISAIENYTGQTFTLDEGVTKIIPGSGRTELPLPRRLYAIDTLEVQGSSLDAADVELDENGSTLFVSPDFDMSWAARAVRDDRP